MFDNLGNLDRIIISALWLLVISVSVSILGVMDENTPECFNVIFGGMFLVSVATLVITVFIKIWV